MSIFSHIFRVGRSKICSNDDRNERGRAAHAARMIIHKSFQSDATAKFSNDDRVPLEVSSIDDLSRWGLSIVFEDSWDAELSQDSCFVSKITGGEVY